MTHWLISRFFCYRALLNSPLIPRRMKGLRNKQAQETISGTVPGEHQRGKQSHLSSRQRPIKRPSDQNIDTEDQYSFNILLGEDSESDEENDECPFGRGLASSCHTTKEGSGAYHNLETFQKNQLKQKVSILRMDIRYNYRNVIKKFVSRYIL